MHGRPQSRRLGTVGSSLGGVGLYLGGVVLCILIAALAATAHARPLEPTLHEASLPITTAPVQQSPTEQTGRIVGSAIDVALGNDLPGVQIFIEGTTMGTITDDDGRFALDSVPSGHHVIVARYVGFRTATRDVTVASGETSEVEFRLVGEAVRLQNIVVTAIGERQDRSRVAATLGTIDQAAIERTRPSHPSEIMNRIPGVWVNTTSGEGHMTAIRQPLTTDPVYLFLENGVPTRSTGFFNHNALYEVNVPMADRVEIIKGPGTALYGSDAVGAVVNVETRRPSIEPKASISLEGGAFGFGRIMVGTGATYGRHGLRLDFNGTRSDGWRDASAFDRQSGTLTWEVDLPGVSRLRTVASFSHVDQEPAGASAVSEADFDANPTTNYTPISFRRVNAVRISSAYERFAARTSIALTPYVRLNEMDILPNWSLTYDPTSYTAKNVSAGLLARYRRDLAVLNALAVTGVDLEFSPGSRIEHSISPVREESIFTSYTTGDMVYDYAVSFQQAAPYAHLEAEPLQRLRLSGGLRLDILGYDYDNRLSVVTDGRYRRAPSTIKTYTHLSPKFGAVYRFAGFGNVFGTYAHAFRVPSEEQVFRQGATNNTLDLKPVRADNLEAGLRGRVSAAEFEVSVFRMIKRDDIVSIVDAEGVQISTNAGRTSHRGVEAGFTISAAPGLVLRGSHSHTVHRFDRWQTAAGTDQDFSGNEIDAAPRTITNASLEIEPPGLAGYSVSVEWMRLGDYWMDPANTVKYDGHSLFNVRATADLPAGFSAFGRIMNMTNKRYAERAAFNTFRGSEYAPGMPRALYFGLEYNIRADR